ncbi:MAG: protease inhibitor I42 family protein [Acidobacteriaceae bacterium]|nr:protease inhibitor I42 family protein [Acidobacteriaceae bacterium]
MTSYLVAAGLGLQILAYRESAVWHPPTDFRSRVLTACENRGAAFGQCFADQMKAAGASPEALAFTRLIHGDGFIQAFRPVARVGVASVFYPFRANENYGLYLINGQPAAVNIDDLQRLPQDQMDFDPAYAAAKNSYSNADLWPGDRSSTSALLALIFPGGSQQFVAGYRVQAGCHACAVLGQAFFSFNFDPAGKFTGTEFSGFSPHYAFSEIASDKQFSVKPGSRFTLVLPSNRSTGYAWQLGSVAASVLQSLGHKYDLPGTTRLGQEGHELWTFQAVKPGQSTLHFSYG